MPKFKVSTNKGHNFIFDADDQLGAQNEFIAKAIDDWTIAPGTDYGEIINIKEISSETSSGKKLKSIICNSKGEWFDIEDCTVIFDVDIDKETNLAIPKNSSMAISLEEMCVISLKNISKQKLKAVK